MCNVAWPLPEKKATLTKIARMLRRGGESRARSIKLSSKGVQRTYKPPFRNGFFLAFLKKKTIKYRTRFRREKKERKKEKVLFEEENPSA